MSLNLSPPPTPTVHPGSVFEVFWAFLKLGLTAFGGPVAHLGYFRDELVLQRAWLDDTSYASLVALCQLLPGPTSSQLGFSLGVLRGGGLLGGLAAWLAFTLPSALLLAVCALTTLAFTGPAAQGALHGLKLVAVAIIAQALWGMARTLTPDKPRALIALCALALVSVSDSLYGQLGAIVLGATAGRWLSPGHTTLPQGLTLPALSRRKGAVALGLFAAGLLLLPLLAQLTGTQTWALVDAFYRAGALVFGGGHVVLPLLQAEVVNPGWVDENAFITAYGLTQAVPGPLFTVAAYLGAAMTIPPQGIVGATLALTAIFVPGLLLIYGVLPFWHRLPLTPAIQGTLRGANAAVVGILAAALYDPVWKNAVLSPADAAFAAAGFLLLIRWHAPSWAVVLLLAGSGAWLGPM